MRKFIEYLVYSNVWISAGAAGLAMLFYQITSTDLNIFLLGFIFFSTLLTYTFQRYMKLYYGEKINGPRMEWMKANAQAVKAILIIGMIGTVGLATQLSLDTLILLGVLGAISFFYAFKFGKSEGSINLRDIPGLKIFLIGGVWGFTCAILPAMESGTITKESLMLMFAFTVYIIGITIPFDIRDLDYDEKSKMTIPQVVGIRFSKLIAVTLVVISYLCMSHPYYELPDIAVAMLFSIALILLSAKEKDELFYSFGLDGLLILLPMNFYLWNIL